MIDPSTVLWYMGCFCPWNGGSVEMKTTTPSHSVPWCSSSANVRYFSLENATLQLEQDFSLEKRYFPSCPYRYHSPCDCRCCACIAAAPQCSQETPHPPSWLVLWCGEWRLETAESSLNMLELSPPSAGSCQCIPTIKCLIRKLLPEEWAHVELNLLPDFSKFHFLP